MKTILMQVKVGYNVWHFNVVKMRPIKVYIRPPLVSTNSKGR